MVFALGFLSAGLLTLLFLPLFWRRAVRLSTHRLEMQMPLSMQEIVAERDQLRATHATEKRRIEQQTQLVRDAHAGNFADLGRRTAETVVLGEALHKVNAELESVKTSLDQSDSQLREARTEIGAMHQVHFDISGHADATARHFEELRGKHAALTTVAEQRRATIAGLETRSEGLAMALADSQQALAAARTESHAGAAKIAGLSDTLAKAQQSLAGAVARRDEVQATSIDQQLRVEELEKAHRAERRMREQLDSQLTGASEALHALQTTSEASVAAGPEELAAPGREEAAELRQSISEFGAEVLRLAASLKAESESRAREGGVAKTPAERVVELQARAKRTAPTH